MSKTISDAYRMLAAAIVAQAYEDIGKWERSVATDRRTYSRGTPATRSSYLSARRFLKTDWCDFLKSFVLGVD